MSHAEASRASVTPASFRDASGRRVVSLASAEDLGSVGHLVVHESERRVGAVVVGRGRSARLVGWEALSGFGPDAVVVRDEDALVDPATDQDKAAARGQLDLPGKRVLTERGTEVGAVDDVLFDPGSGALMALVVGDREIPPSALVGHGSYAVVVAVEGYDGGWWAGGGAPAP